VYRRVCCPKTHFGSLGDGHFGRANASLGILLLGGLVIVSCQKKYLIPIAPFNSKSVLGTRSSKGTNSKKMSKGAFPKR